MRPRFVQRLPLLALSLAGLASLAAGCGDRPAVWDTTASGATSYGLEKAVALIDAPASRVVALGVDADGGLKSTRLPIGHGVAAAKVGPGGGRLYVLTAGHRGSLGDTQPDENPRLTIIDGTTNPATSRDIDLDLLTAPLDGLAIDPTERWAVLYAASGTGGAFVANPNELVVVDLAPTAGGAARSKVLHSFGGHPEKLTFTPELLLPKGPSHLLIVQSAQDFALVSLDALDRPEVTVRLADATAVTRPHPAEIVVDDGEAARSDDARVGIRFDNGTSVMTLQLEPAAGENGYAPTINLADVGGVPSAIAFVRTDGGLRLAALVPSRQRAVLVEPATTITSDVALPASYQQLSLVTATAGAPAGADVALLWNGAGTQAGVAFWELGKAAGLPFRSIETVGIDAKVDGVRDVPGKNAALKLLSTASAGAFYVLDLGDRTATPLLTAAPNVALSVSPTGERVWAYVAGGFDLAMTGLPDKHVTTLRVDSTIAAAYEIAGAGGAPALVVLHAGAGVGATVFDGRMPDEAHRRIYGALLTGGTP